MKLTDKHLRASIVCGAGLFLAAQASAQTAGQTAGPESFIQWEVAASSCVTSTVAGDVVTRHVFYSAPVVLMSSTLDMQASGRQTAYFNALHDDLRQQMGRDLAGLQRVDSAAIQCGGTVSAGIAPSYPTENAAREAMRGLEARLASLSFDPENFHPTRPTKSRTVNASVDSQLTLNQAQANGLYQQYVADNGAAPAAPTGAELARQRLAAATNAQSAPEPSAQPNAQPTELQLAQARLAELEARTRLLEAEAALAEARLAQATAAPASSPAPPLTPAPEVASAASLPDPAQMVPSGLSASGFLDTISHTATPLDRVLYGGPATATSMLSIVEPALRLTSQQRILAATIVGTDVVVLLRGEALPQPRSGAQAFAVLEYSIPLSSVRFNARGDQVYRMNSAATQQIGDAANTNRYYTANGTIYQTANDEVLTIANISRPSGTGVHAIPQSQYGLNGDGRIFPIGLVNQNDYSRHILRLNYASNTGGNAPVSFADNGQYLATMNGRRADGSWRQVDLFIIRK